MEFGSTLHAALESLLLGKDDFSELFEFLWDSVRLDKKVQYGRYSWEELARLGPMFLRKFKKAHAKDIKVIEMEVRRKTDLLGDQFEGTPDTIAFYKGKPSVIDFKTSGYSYDKDKILIAEQLFSYCLLELEKSMPVPEQVIYFVFVKSSGSIQKPLILEIDQNLLDKTRLNVRRWIDKYKAEKEWPKNTESCFIGASRCQYFNRCHGKKE